MPSKVAGNLTVLAKVPGQLRVPYLPDERRSKLRDARVRDVVLYAAETVPYYRSPEGKRLIEEHFGIPLLSHYNAVKTFHIGFLCEERRHFHLHDDLTHLTIVDDAGRKCPPCSVGEVVVSNLVNRGTVLLNYRLGDRAARVAGGCSCGRTTPLLSDLEGRVEDILTLPDGNLLTGGRIWNIVKRRPEVLRYQFVQAEPLGYELKLMTAENADYDSIVDGMLGEIRAIVGPSATVEASYHESLEAGPGGKFRTILNLCKPL